MNPPPSPHPNPSALKAFGLGRLDAAGADTVAAHLTACDDCRRAVAEASGDSFTARLVASREPAPASGPWTESSVSAAPALPPGLADLPGYEIVRELGRGGMGVVYLARNTEMGRPEVLKVMGREVLDRPGAGERFTAEIHAAARLGHPNIVTAYATKRVGDLFVFAMEFVDGQDLHKVVLSGGPLPVKHATFYAYQAALGLQHAHEKGMAHRDIKPHNLILHKAGKKHTVKILDFGLAKVDDRPADHGLTREGQALGTPAYMAPEQIKDARSVDTRGDIYALGCTLYFLLAGRPPFQAESLYALFGQHLTVEATPLNQLRPDIPEGLAAVVARMMAKDPAARFQTPAEAAHALAPFFRAGGPPASGEAAVPAVAGASSSQPELWASLADVPAPVAEPTPVAKPRRGSPLVWAAAAAGVTGFALLAALAAGVFKLKTPDGTIVVENVPADAEVLVEGGTVRIARAGDEVTVSAAAGKRYPLRVVGKDGKPILTREVELDVGGAAVRVRVEPPAVAKVTPPRAPNPGVPATTVSDELLVNGDCSDATLKGWQNLKGKWYQKVSPVRNVFCAGNCKEGILQQEVDVTRFAADIDAGRVEFRLAGEISSFDADRGQFRMVFLDHAGGQLAAGYDSGEHAHKNQWVTYEGVTAAPPKTRAVRVTLRAVMAPRVGNQECSGYLDNISLKAVVRARVEPPPATPIPAPTLSGKYPPPPPDLLAALQKEARDGLKAEIASGNLTVLNRAGKKFLEEADRRTHPHERFALIDLGRDLLARATDLPAALAAAARLDKEFVVDYPAVKVRTLRQITWVELPADGAERTVIAVLAAGSEGLAADSFAAAREAGGVAETLGRKLNQSAYVSQGRFLVAEADRAEAAYNRLPPAAKGAEAPVADPAANAAAGLYAGLVKNEWPRAVEFLRAGGPAWAGVATGEGKLPATADGLAALGDLWWQAADTLPPADAPAARRRARRHYLAALDKAKPENRDDLAARLQPRIDVVPQTPTTVRVRLAALSGYHWLRITHDGVVTSGRGARKITGDIWANHLKWTGEVKGHRNAGAARLLPDGLDFTTAVLRSYWHSRWGAICMTTTPAHVELTFWHNPANENSSFDLVFEVESGFAPPSRFTRQWDVAYYNFPPGANPPPPLTPSARDELFAKEPADRMKLGTVNFVSEASPLDAWRPGAPPTKKVKDVYFALAATTTWRMPAGRYKVRLLVDDGARVWVAGKVVFDHWVWDGKTQFLSDEFAVPAGDHPVKVEYHQHAGTGFLQFDLVRVGD